MQLSFTLFTAKCRLDKGKGRMTAIDLLQQAGEERLGFDGNTGRAQFEKDPYAIADVRANVENKRPPADELSIKAAVTAGPARLAVVNEKRTRKAPKAPEICGRHKGTEYHTTKGSELRLG